jgi:acylphosphatase
VRRVRVIVRGRVQGVFFRAACATEARARGVGGWVRNLPDGSLEAAFEGPDADVETMIEWCRSGPPSARVDGLDVTDQAPVGDTAFRIAG